MGCSTSTVKSVRFRTRLPIAASVGEAIERREKREFTPLGQNGNLQLRHISGRGIGVITSVPIHDRSLVERCPAFLIERAQTDFLRTRLEPYSGSSDSIRLGHVLFPWVTTSESTKEDRAGQRAMLLGYGMLYNHEPQGRSNLRHVPYIDPGTNRRFVDFYATRDIQAGDELTHTYTTPDRLWFLEKPGLGQ